MCAELEKKIREAILKEGMDGHNINDSLHFTKDDILKALKTIVDGKTTTLNRNISVEGVLHSIVPIEGPNTPLDVYFDYVSPSGIRIEEFGDVDCE